MKLFTAYKKTAFVVISLLVVILLSVNLFTPTAYAQQNPYLTPNTDSNVPANLNTYSQSVVIETLNAVSCLVTGVDFLTANHQCLGVNPVTGKLGYNPSDNAGLAVTMGHMISILYRPVMHTSDYVNYLSSNFITRKAYAATPAGKGFQGLNPLLSVWVPFRNLVYLMFVVIMILIGLAIMLRVKLDAKTAVNIQNSLPKLIIGILLVTFSFAIAGLLIDMMYLSTYVVVNVMTTTVDPPSATTGQNGVPLYGISSPYTLGILNQTPIGFTDQLFHGQGPCDANIANADNCGIFGIVGATSNATSYIINTAIGEIVSTNGFLQVLLGIFDWDCFSKAISAWVPFVGHGPSQQDWQNCAGTVAQALTVLLVWLVLYFAILSALFRLWWDLIKAYVYVLLYTCMAPFMIAIGVLPGNHMGFGSWLKGMVSHLAIFPVIIFMFLLAKTFIDKLAISNGNYFVPPLLGNFTSQGNGSTFNVGYLIGFGIILITPSILEQLNSALGHKPGPSLGAFGTGLAAGTALSAGAFGSVGNVAKWGFKPGDKNHQEGPLRRIFLGKNDFKATTVRNPFSKNRGLPVVRQNLRRRMVNAFERRNINPPKP